jgi:hypothetical protein
VSGFGTEWCKLQFCYLWFNFYAIWLVITFHWTFVCLCVEEFSTSHRQRSSAAQSGIPPFHTFLLGWQDALRLEWYLILILTLLSGSSHFHVKAFGAYRYRCEFRGSGSRHRPVQRVCNLEGDGMKIWILYRCDLGKSRSILEVSISAFARRGWETTYNVPVICRNSSTMSAECNSRSLPLYRPKLLFL